MRSLTTKEDITRYMRNNPGEKFTAMELTAHFMCGEGTIRTLLKSLLNANQIESTGGNTMARNKYRAVQYYISVIDVSEVDCKPVRPLQMTLAKRIALERCAESIPPDRPHHCCTSRLPPNNLDKD
jgi:hypothetical protein